MSNRKADWPARLKWIVFPASLLPAAWLLQAAFANQLGPDPAKTLVDQTGLWAFRFLLLSLTMTPMRRLSRQAFWIRYRRMLGLFALFYAVLHVMSYVFLLFGAEWGALAGELTKRPYIMVGSLALLILLSLGITSTRGWQRRLRQRWVRLHRLVYAASLLVLLHFSWVNKLGLTSIWPYALALFLLLGMRIWWNFRQSERNS